MYAPSWRDDQNMQGCFMKKTICLLPGDGIGPEIVAQGVKVLEATAEKSGHQFVFETALIGGD